MKLIQITDIHLTTPGQTIAGRDPNANFVRALTHALDHHPDAEAVIITGDLSDWGEAEDYERLKAIIADTQTPVHLCIGNHDDRETFLQIFPQLRDDAGFVQNVVPLSKGHAVLLDTWENGTHAGSYCERRARWLDAALDTLDGPVWIFMHHNPVPMGMAAMDQIMLQDADRLGAVLSAHREKIAHLFHGHCHLPLAGSFRGIPFTAPRGTNHAGWPDFGDTKVLAGSDLPEAYAVIQIHDHGDMMIHMVEYGYGGPIRREGSPDKAEWDKLTMVR